MDIEWRRSPTGGYSERWIMVVNGNYADGGGLRVIKTDGEWQIRFGPGDVSAVRERYPGTLNVEEAQAVAIAWWRMK